MSFPIQRSKPIMIFVSVMLILMVALPVGMLIVNKENWGSARIGMAFVGILAVVLLFYYHFRQI
ncbi:hypothetical protein, partial [Bacillus sp. UNC437CL72CviS29]|uniref:hypothetical protein n=1 Tax=Bacillus sp. UNC437CL72CviS29 TaxID=1340430 RepID=UPI00055666EF